MKNLRFPLWAFVCLLATALIAAAPPEKPKPPAGPVPAEDMQGLVFDGLTPEQKTLALSILNDNGCDCGCGMKVGVCRRDDPKCPRSPLLGKQVIDLVKQGKSKDEIVKIALTPPSKFVQFALTAGDDPAIGPKDAKVTILHYFDYQCPFCTRVGPALDQILKDYPNDVRIVYKMHPLSMHPNAMPAAEAAMAAHAQGKFFEMHKKLFQNQQQLTREKFVEYAKEIGLDVGKFTKDLDAHTYAAGIQKNTSDVEGIGATGTPASFINGRFLNGAKPYTAFKEVIDEEIGWAKAGKRPEFKIAKNVSEASAKGSAAAGPDPNKVYDIAAGSAPFKGPAKAKVTILHYFDYQCPFCVKVAPTFEQILKEYPNDVRVVYKMHPLPMHQNAMPAAQAAMAANAQGKFAEMHEKLFANSSSLSRDKYLQLAAEIGLDVKKFTSDIDGQAYKKTIDAETAEAMNVGATGTPASFVNGRFLSGAQPYAAFKKIIDEELAKEIAKATK
jgi:protein-disulfide isomerase